MKIFVSIVMAAALALNANGLAAQQLPEGIAGAVKYRSVGSTRHSGRFVDFAVYEKNPATFYAALASGGLWKTVNNGITLTPVSVPCGELCHPEGRRKVWGDGLRAGLWVLTGRDLKAWAAERFAPLLEGVSRR